MATRLCGTVRRLSGRLSARGQLLASGGGAAAQVWESVNALAARPGMINMGQGFPDFPGSAIARRVAAAAVESGEPALAQYTPQPGAVRLRAAVAAYYQHTYAATYDPADEVVVTTGGQEALAAAFLAFLDPGDEVVVFEPFYPFMMGALRLAGAVPRVVTLQPPGFELDAAAIDAACASPRAKMLVLNSPHNPTGHVASAAELRAVAEACRRHGLIALSDEVYEHCVFPDAGGGTGGGTGGGGARRHLRLADAPGMRERTVTLSSGGKLFSLTGWRVAWAVGPRELVGALGRAHTHLTFSAPTPLQEGIAAALEAEVAAPPADGCGAVASTFAANFATLGAALRAGAGVRRICEAQGGYFLVAETDGRADVDFCHALAHAKGVVCTPMSVFYATPFAPEAPCTLVRFTVCKSAAHVARACEALLREDTGDAPATPLP